MSLSIVYLGNFEPPHSTENDYARSFEALGHSVTRLQEPHAPAGALRFLRSIRRAVELSDARLLLYTRTWGVLPRAETTEVWRWAEARGTRTAAVHLDRWAGLAREAELREQAMFTMGTVFTADGDAGPLFEAAGVNHRWLRAGVLASECYDADPDPGWARRWDVAFVGSAPTESGGNYHPEWPHRAELVERLHQWFGDRFAHIGNGGMSLRADGHALRGHALNAFYASVPVVIGDSCLVRCEGRYWSDRVYETWGRGGYLIHPWCEALDAELGITTPGWDAGDWDHLRRVIRNAFAYPGEREAERRRIAQIVRGRCTYTHRAAELLEALGLSGER